MAIELPYISGIIISVVALILFRGSAQQLLKRQARG